MARATLTSWERCETTNAGPEYGGIRLYRHSVTSGRRGNLWCDEVAFSDLSFALLTRKASTMRSSASTVVNLWVQQWWRNESGRQASALSSLSVFGGNFVWTKVHWGLISVRCSELRGIRFSEVSTSRRFEMYSVMKNQPGTSEINISPTPSMHLTYTHVMNTPRPLAIKHYGSEHTGDTD